MHFRAKFWTHAPPQAAGAVYFAMDIDDVPAASGSRPDRLTNVSGPQERVLRHTVEQIVDSVPWSPVLNAPVPQMGCGEVGDVLGRGEPLPPHEQAAGVLTDLSQLDQVRRRTAMDFYCWYADLV